MNYAGYTHLLPGFCHMTLHFFHVFLVEQWLRFQCLPYQVPLWSTGALWSCGEFSLCRCPPRQVVLLTRGQLFGELALMGDQPRAATARCAMPQGKKKTEVLFGCKNLGIAKGHESNCHLGEWSWISSSHSNVSSEGF